MENYSIFETYTLPSEGKIYSTKVDPTVRIRSMTTDEEMRRLAQTDHPYLLMSEIIKDCMLDDIGIHPYDMCIGDYLFLMHKLRIVTYGQDYGMTSICPLCKHSNTDTIQLDNLCVLPFPEDVDKLFEFDLPVTKKHVKINYQTPRMLEQVDQRVDEYRKKSKDKSRDPRISYTAAYLIKEIDGVPVDIISTESWVNQLPMLDTQTILAHADRINKDIGLDLDLEVVCEACGLTYFTSFRTTPEFFRPEIHI